MLSLIESTFASLAVPIVGMVIPSYLSFKALNGQGEPKALLAYWVCFAIYMQVTFVLETLCLHEWVPLYYVFKVGGLCYLVAPQVRLTHDSSSARQQELTRYDALAICSQTNAATELYDKYIGPFLKTHEEKIDAKVAERFELASRKFAALKAQVTQVAKEGSANAAADTPSRSKPKKVAHAD
jgi:hypothetical protein